MPWIRDADLDAAQDKIIAAKRVLDLWQYRSLAQLLSEALGILAGGDPVTDASDTATERPIPAKEQEPPRWIS